MRALGNILWHIPFLGFLTAFGTFIVGGLFMATVIGAPIGLTLIRLSKLFLAPFSYAMVPSSDVSPNKHQAWRIFGILVWILYLPFGIVLSLLLMVQIACVFCTIVGIPVALALAKALPTFFMPVNKKCVPVAVRDELQARKARAQVDKHLG
ncbi:MAG: YccF domain-containing protein [Bacteroidales bacterium]